MLYLFDAYASIKFTLFQQLSNIAIFMMIVLGSWMLQHYAIGYIFKRVKSNLEKRNLLFKKEIFTQFESPVRSLSFVTGLIVAISYALNVSILKFPLIQHVVESIITYYTLKIVYNEINFWGENPDVIRSKLNLNIESVLFPFFSRMTKVLVIVLGFGLIAFEWGYDISGLVTGLGIGGLALALGAKDIFSHMFGGFTIALDKPFTIGDWISTDNDIEGIVEDMNFRSTKIRSFDKAVVYIPNAVLANQSIYNWSRRRNRRVRFFLGLSYSTPPEKIKRVVQRLKEVINQHDGVDNDAVYVVFDNYNSSSLDILVQFLTNTSEFSEFLDIKQDINFEIMRILKEEDVTLAFPSQSIYIEPVDGEHTPESNNS